MMPLDEDDAVCAIKSLCRDFIGPDSLLTEGDQPDIQAKKTMRKAEDEIAFLLESLPVSRQREVAEHIVQTLSLRLYKMMPSRDNAVLFSAPIYTSHLTFQASFEHFKAAVDMGLYPEEGDNYEGDTMFKPLMDLCADPTGMEWRSTSRTFLNRWNGTLSHALWFARDEIKFCRKHAQNKSPTICIDTLIKFLSDLIQDQVNQNPERAQKILVVAAQASCSFDVLALLIAGVPCPNADDVGPIKGPKVAKVLDYASSNHGLLPLIARNGPLEQYIARGGDLI